MNNLFISFLVLIVFLFHQGLRTQIKHGKVKECFCAIWFIDTVFAICGSAISFALYQYHFLPFLTWRNLLICLMYIVLTLLVFLISPSGFALFRRNKDYSATDTLLAEYRFHDTIGLIRSFFMLLLFIVPVVMTILTQTESTAFLLLTWDAEDICGAVCFISFLFLVPLSLRQTLFWLKNLLGTPLVEEAELLKKYSTQMHFKSRNYRL